MKFEKHDIIEWSNPAGTKEYRVVDVWNDEPKQLLLAEIENDGSGKCFIALQVDCSFLCRAAGPSQTFERKPNTAKPILKVDNKPMGDG